MQPSATLCRMQGAIQLARAENATLANVRQLATAAAVAWFKEADDAEKRELRREIVKAHSAEAALPGSHAVLDDAMSENAERGQSIGRDR